MKKILFALAAFVACLSAYAATEPGKVIAVVAGRDGGTMAIVVEYNATLSAKAVTNESFVIPGKEVGRVVVLDRNPFERPQGGPGGPGGGQGMRGQGGGPGMMEGRDGKFVVVFLKEALDMMRPGEGGGPRGEGGGYGRPEGVRPEGGRPEIPVPEISVKQVSSIATTDGGSVAAWTDARAATEAVPFRRGRRP